MHCITSGCKHGKVDQKVLRYTKNLFVWDKRPKWSSKVLFKGDFFLRWLLLLCWILKCRKSSWDLKYSSLKVMLKSKWLSLILSVNFMTLAILKLESSFIFLEFTIYLRATSHDFVENHQFNVILSYFKQILDNHLFNITYLHNTCIVFLSM